MPLFRKKSRDRVCVIGLDGVPHSLLSRFVEDGTMPALASLVRKGHLHRLKASLPEISAVSWTDFMTGTNSGTHGIFGFTDLKPDSYSLRFPNALDVKAPTFWDKLGERGKTCIVVNQPSTYPARKINGALVAGFVALEFEKAVWPASHIAPLREIGYQVDIDTLRAREDPDFFWQDLNREMAGKERAFDYFWGQDWDFFEFVVTGTDRLHHYHWPAAQDPGHRFHGPFLDFYRRVDKLIDRVADAAARLDPQLLLYMLSDHGFTGIDREVYLNAWLRQEGYLRLAPESPQALDALTAETKAFALDPNRIYLNVEGRFPKGTVKPSDKQALKNELASKLEKLTWEGRRVVRRVFDTAEVYSGPRAVLGPDLIVLSEFGFDMKGSMKKNEVFGQTDLQGMHTWDDAFFLAPEDWGDGLAISGLADIILRHYA